MALRRMEDAPARAPGERGAPGSPRHNVLWELFVPTSADLPEEYLRFQALDCLQAACSYLRGVLTLHSTLTGAGIASADGASAAAAVLAFILKDGSGHIGSLAGSYCLSTHLDSEVKSWRLFADVANDVGLTLELVAPVFGPRYFLGVTCLANVCKALCGVAAGGTRVAISQHFSRGGGNVAEIASKEGAQETAVTLLGLVIGYYCSGRLNSSRPLQWGAFALLTVIHVWANYSAVRCLQLTSVNRSRAFVLADAFCDALEGDDGSSSHPQRARTREVPARAPLALQLASPAGGGRDGGPPASPFRGASASVVTVLPGDWEWRAPPSPAAVAAVEPVVVPAQHLGPLLAALGRRPAEALLAVARALGSRVTAEGATVGVLRPRRRAAPDGGDRSAPLPPLAATHSVPVRITVGQRLVAGGGGGCAAAVAVIARQAPGAAAAAAATGEQQQHPVSYVAVAATAALDPAVVAAAGDFVAVCLRRQAGAGGAGRWEVGVTLCEGGSAVTQLVGYVAAVHVARALLALPPPPATAAAPGAPLHQPPPPPQALLDAACARVARCAPALLHGLAVSGWDVDALRLDADGPHRVRLSGGRGGSADDGLAAAAAPPPPGSPPAKAPPGGAARSRASSSSARRGGR